MRKTARQEVIDEEINASRKYLIHCELMTGYLKDAKEKAEEGELDLDALMSMIPAHKSLDDIIIDYEEQRKVQLHKLNFFKDLRKTESDKITERKTLRKKELDKIAEKEALKVKNTIPQKIKVSVVDTVNEK